MQEDIQLRSELTKEKENKSKGTLSPEEERGKRDRGGELSDTSEDASANDEQQSERAQRKDPPSARGEATEDFDGKHLKFVKKKREN